MDNSTARPYLVGSRAAGMGGAATALADDGGGPYYNPGGIAFALASSLSLSASVYGVVRGEIDDGRGSGPARKYQDINAFPVSTSAVFKWGPRAESDGAPINALAISVFVPDSLVIDDRNSPAPGQATVFQTISQQTIWAGTTYARRYGRLGVGLSGYLLIGKQIASIDITAVDSPSAFAVVSARMDTTIVGLVGALGARYDVSDHLKLGLSVFSQEAGLYQSRRAFQRFLIADPANGVAPQIEIADQGGLHASPTQPWRFQLGAAWVTEGWTFAADAMFLTPLEVRDDTESIFSQHIKRNPVVNGSIGAEYLARGSFPVRAGFFTDFAASPRPHSRTADGDSGPDNTQHVNRFGGSFSVGWRTLHTATDIGAIVSYGSGQEMAMDLRTDYQEVTRMTQLLAYIFLASSYQF